MNQGVFRKRLLRRYNQCCLCGVCDTRLMKASHIKPWSVSSSSERIDVDNGLLLCPNHDSLFDGGLISFDEEGNILISDSLLENNRIFLNVREDMKIEVRDGNKKYLKYHRESIFQK